MIEIRYRKLDPPGETFTEEFVVLAGRKRKPIGRVGRRRLDLRWDAIPDGRDTRCAIERSRADAVGALMDWKGIG